MSSIRKQLTRFVRLRGFIGATISNIDGVVIDKLLVDDEILIDRLATIMSHALNNTQNITKTLNLGELEFIELDTKDKIVIVNCHRVKDVHFHTIVLLNRHTGNVAMFKSIMSDVISSVARDLLQPQNTKQINTSIRSEDLK